MAENSHRPIRADELLRVRSDTEALDLGATEQTITTTRRTSESSSSIHWQQLVRFWSHYVVLSVSHNDCRDHFANERTALGWIRTGQAFAMAGVITSQVMRITHAINPDPVLGYFVVSIPLSCICHIMAIITTVMGIYRYLHWQHAMARGNAISSGWELLTTFVLSLLILLSIFVLAITIMSRDIDR